MAREFCHIFRGYVSAQQSYDERTIALLEEIAKDRCASERYHQSQDRIQWLHDDTEIEIAERVSQVKQKINDDQSDLRQKSKVGQRCPGENRQKKNHDDLIQRVLSDERALAENCFDEIGLNFCRR